MVDNISGLPHGYMGYGVSNNQKTESSKESNIETDWTTNAADAVSKAFQSVDDVSGLFQSE